MRPRGRWDRAPEDLARSIERDRLRFQAALMIAPGPWKIAKAIVHDVDDHGGEGLRGIYDDSDGSLAWWRAHIASHHQGRLMLGKGVGHPVIEVEVNVARDGTLYLSWESAAEAAMVERFLAHPTMTPLVEGCLAVGGRQIQIRGGRVRLLRKPATEADAAPPVGPVRQRLAAAMLADAYAWSRSRAPFPDGRAKPSIAALRIYRMYIAEELADGWRPIPDVTVMGDGGILLSWRATGSIATVRLCDDGVRIRVNMDGRVDEWQSPRWTTPRQVRLDAGLNRLGLTLTAFRGKGEDA